jgi:hypothetical protein
VNWLTREHYLRVRGFEVVALAALVVDGIIRLVGDLAGWLA